MNLSKLKNVVAGKLNKVGSNYTSNNNTFKAVIAKAQVSYDKSTHEFTLLAAHNANITDGYLITGQDNRFVPTKIDKPTTSGGNAQYTRGYLKQVNASIDISSYIDPANASKDVWGDPTGTDGTDWGWVIQKTGVFVNFERMEMRPDNERIGQIEDAEYLVTVPLSVNASITPIPELRVTDRNSNNWKVLDVDNKTFDSQSYIMRVSTDDR